MAIPACKWRRDLGSQSLIHVPPLRFGIAYSNFRMLQGPVANLQSAVPICALRRLYSGAPSASKAQERYEFCSFRIFQVEPGVAHQEVAPWELAQLQTLLPLTQVLCPRDIE